MGMDFKLDIIPIKYKYLILFILPTYRLSEKGVQTLVWDKASKAWTPTKIFI
jgi:hypothetical protein